MKKSVLNLFKITAFLMLAIKIVVQGEIQVDVETGQPSQVNDMGSH